MSSEIDTSQVLEQLIITTQKEHIQKAEQIIEEIELYISHQSHIYTHLLNMWDSSPF